MKNKITLLTLALIISVGMFAQAPNLINYQAVARNIAGQPLLSQPVNVTFDIRQSTSSGAIVYSETHVSSTNQFGLFNLEIGGGTPVTGTFAAINWSTGLYYLQITINGDVMPATQLLSVPFALHANTATSGTPGVDGNDNLSVVTPEAPGANCATGGNMVEVGVDDNANGTLELGEVDFTYFVCNGLNGGAGNDTSATNELQTISVSNDTIFLTNGGFAVLPPAIGDNWGSQVVIIDPNSNLTGDGTAATPLSIIDNDTSSTNELELPMTGNTIGDVLKWNGSAWVNAIDSFVDADNDPTNEIELPATAVANQVLTWNGSAWVAQNAGAGADNWGSQVVQISGTNISGDGTGGNPLVVTEGDPSPTNEIQNLSTAGNTINISGGTGTNISATGPVTGDYLYWNGLNWVAQTIPANTDNQDLSLAGNTLSLTNDATPVDLTPYLDNTDAQTLTYNSGTQDLSISGGNSITLDVNDADNDPNNERITTFSVNGTNDSLVIVESGVGHAMPLSDLSDGDWTKGAGVIHNTSDNVGIGTASPSTKLEVAGGNILLRDQTNVINAVELTSGSGAGASGALALMNSGTTVVSLSGVGTSWINSGGNFGIGNNAPATNLHVTGNTSILRLQSTQTNTFAQSMIEFGNTPAGFNSKGSIGNPGSGDHIQYEALTFHMFSTQGTERMRIVNSGEVGIGTFSPFSLLDVNGQITMRTGATNGYIPVSDANGTMTWTDPATVNTASVWSGGAGTIFQSTLTDLVGIGTSSPDVALNIFGSNTSTTTNAFNPSPETTIRLYNSDLTNNNFSAISFTTIMSNAASSEMAKIVGQNVNHTIGTQRGDLVFLTRNSSNLNEAMRVTGDGFLGLGTTSPLVKLDLYTNTSTRGAQLIQDFSSTTDKYGIYALAQGANSGVNYGVSGEAISSTTSNIGVRGRGFGGPGNFSGYFDLGDFYIADNLGVGTTTPLAKVHVMGDIRNDDGTNNQILRQTGGNSRLETNNYFEIAPNGGGVMFGIDDGNADFYVITGINRNTASASPALNVSNTNLAGDASMSFRGGLTTYSIGSDANDDMFKISNSASGLGTNDRFVINNVGNVGIGTSTPSSPLHVETFSNANGGYFYNGRTTGGNYAIRTLGTSTGGTFNLGIYAQATGPTTTNYGLYGLAQNAGTNWSLYCNGAAFSSSGTWTGSDEKLKTNVQEFKGAVDKLKLLDIKTYNFKTEQYKTLNFPTRKQYGLMAQNLEQVFPEMVMESEHHIPLENGDLTEETVSIKAVNYDQLIPVLIKAVQEQQQMIDELKQEIQDLKNQ